MNNLFSPAAKNKRIYDALFIGVIVFVIAFKFNDLFLAYFWDELGVYAPAAIYQYEHSLSLMPASVPVYLSRGHPLLFTLLHGSVMKVFGNRVFVAHAFALFISLVMLWTVYVKTCKYFNPLSAIVAVALLAVQPVFLAQSCLVLPEITLSLFIFLSLANYYEKKYILFSLFASLAILTKESAFVLPFAVIAYSLVQWLVLKNRPSGLKTFNIILTLTPFGVFGIFLLLQKQQNGWYFFPYHWDLVSFEPDRFKSQFSSFFNFIFWKQGRYWCEKIIFIGLFFSLLANRLNWRSAGKSFFTLAGIFVLFFFTFSSLCFYMERYLMAILFPVFMAVAVSLTNISSNKIFIAFAVIFLCVIAFEQMEDRNFQYDTDLGYRRQIHVTQLAFDYVAEFSKPGETLNASFPAYSALELKCSGYFKNIRLNTTRVYSTNADYFLVSSQAPFEINWEKYDITLLKAFNDGFAEMKIYRIKEKHKK